MNIKPDYPVTHNTEARCSMKPDKCLNAEVTSKPKVKQDVEYK